MTIRGEETMKANTFFKRVSTALVAATGVLLLTGVASAAELVISSYGGSFQEAQTKAYFDPYAKASGVKVTATTGTGYAKVKAMVESGNVTWDVISAESPAFANEVKDGLLEPIDYSVVKADNVPENFRTKYGVGYMVFGTNLAWNKDKFPNGVKPAQFFDPSVKGRRVLPSDATYSLEFALMGDGVKPADLYPLDVQRALKVIDRVKDQVIGYKGASDIQALMQQGEADMVYAGTGRIKNAIKAGANWGYTWEGALADTEYWAVLKGAPHAAEAMKFINFAVQAEQQAELTRVIAYGPTNVDALRLLDPAVAKDLPSYPANAKLGAVINSKWWNDNYETVKAEWATFIMQ